MLTERDKKIIKFMEDIGLGLTIHQAALMFFPRKFAYDYARNRLKKLWEMGAIKKYTNSYSGELIYYLDKKPSYHSNAVLNIYANFISAGYLVTCFKHEQHWLDGKYKSDAFLKVENDNEIRLMIVELDHTHPTEINKYEAIYETNELQQVYGDFPMVVVLSDIGRTYKSENFTVINMDVRCTEFNKLLA